MTDETKAELFASNLFHHVWKMTNTPYQYNQFTVVELVIQQPDLGFQQSLREINYFY